MVSTCTRKAEVMQDALVDDDRDRVVQDRLAKDDAVELGVDLVSVEDGKDGHRVRSG